MAHAHQLPANAQSQDAGSFVCQTAGACDGALACSTCHLILEQHVYDALPAPEEEEEDMLDLAFDLTDTSRLGCQIKVTEELRGMKATVPGQLS